MGTPISMTFDLTRHWGGAACQVQSGLLDPAYPEMEHWAQAGVEGGLGPYLPVCETVPAGSSAGAIQAALDRVAAAGGGAVLLESGEYVIDQTLRIPSGVVLRGSYFEMVKLRVTLSGTFKGYDGTDRVVMTDETQPDPDPGTVPFVTAILMENVEGAGLESVTILYDPGLPRPQSLRYLEPGFDTNPTPYDRTDHFVISVGIQESRNCWVEGCRIIDSGTHPLSVIRSKHVTLRFCEIHGAYNTHGGQAYLNCSHSEYVLMAGLAVQDIRHLSIQNGSEEWPCRYNVVIGSDLQVDINYHNGDSGHNLVEDCRIMIPSWHWWGPFAAGVAGMHQPPGPGNLLLGNQAARYRVGRCTRGAPACPDPHEVYRIRHAFEDGLPLVVPVGPAPAGGTLYPVRP